MYAWVEWEAESRVLRRFYPTDPRLPRYLWQPFWTPRLNYGNRVNSDPVVLGGFYYSDCRQAGNEGLRELPRGSVIVFGSPVEGEWVVDTVFVVSKRVPYDVIYYDRVYKSGIDLPDGFEQGVLARSCGMIGGGRERTLYVGATYQEQVDGMFSFFPSKPKPQGNSVGFFRPAIQLPKSYFNPNLAMTAKGAKSELPRKTVKELWLDVKQQILEQGLCLGIGAPFPERQRTEDRTITTALIETSEGSGMSRSA